MFKTEWWFKSNSLPCMGPGNDSKTTTSVCLRKRSRGIPKRSEVSYLCFMPTPFNQVSTIKKTSIWWSNIKLLISDRFTEVLREQALNKDILKELLENRDSERDDIIGTLIKLTLFVLLLAFSLVSFGKRAEIRTWGESYLFSIFAYGFIS